MGASVKAAGGKRQARSRGGNEVKRRVAGDESYYRFVLQRYDGEVLPETAIRLPSVTSIIKAVMGASGGGMAYWGFKLGNAAAHLELQGDRPDDATLESLYEAAKAGPYSPNKQRDAAGERGNAAHDLLESLAKGTLTVEHDAEGVVIVNPANGGRARPQSYTLAVADWWLSERPETVASEQVLYSLNHRYCGSVDLIAERWRGGVVLTDLKTHKPSQANPATAPAYDEDRLQVEAYRQAWNEMYPWDHIVRKSVLLAHEDGTWQEEFVEEPPFEVFLALREAYRHLVEERGAKS